MIVLKGPMQILNSWWATFSEVPQQPPITETLLWVFISCIIYGSVSWQKCGGRREGKLSGGVYRTMKWNSFHTCMCFAQNSAVCRTVMWVTQISIKTRNNTVMNNHILAWTPLFLAMLPSKVLWGPSMPQLTPVLYLFGFSLAHLVEAYLQHKLWLSLVAYTQTTLLHTLVFLTDLRKRFALFKISNTLTSVNFAIAETYNLEFAGCI